MCGVCARLTVALHSRVQSLSEREGSGQLVQHQSKVHVRVFCFLSPSVINYREEVSWCSFSSIFILYLHVHGTGLLFLFAVVHAADTSEVNSVKYVCLLSVGVTFTLSPESVVLRNRILIHCFVWRKWSVHDITCDDCTAANSLVVVKFSCVNNLTHSESSSQTVLQKHQGHYK